MGKLGAGIEAIDREMTRVAPGLYRYEGSDLAFQGRISRL
jgi:hypothetical protein